MRIECKCKKTHPLSFQNNLEQTKKTRSQMTSLWVERPWIDCWSERVQQEGRMQLQRRVQCTNTAQLLTLVMILLLPSDRTSLSIVIGTERSSKNATGANNWGDNDLLSNLILIMLHSLTLGCLFIAPVTGVQRECSQRRVQCTPVYLLTSPCRLHTSAHLVTANPSQLLLIILGYNGTGIPSCYTKQYTHYRFMCFITPSL